MLRDKQKTEIKSSGGREGIKNILSRIVRGNFNAKISAHRPKWKRWRKSILDTGSKKCEGSEAEISLG